MTDNLDELIAEARWVADEHEGAEWEPDAIAMIHRLADALEQVRGSADEWWKQRDKERERAERAEATLAKVREYLRERESNTAGTARWIVGDVLAILDESPTERETPADEWEYRARATQGHTTGEVRMTPESAITAYEEALDDVTFEQPDETPLVERRRVVPWEVVSDDRA